MATTRQLKQLQASPDATVARSVALEERVDRLLERVAQLEQAVDELHKAARPSPAKVAAAKKTTK